MQLNDLVGAERLALVVPILFGAFVKATAIILIGATCALFARGASAATRHLIWTLTLGGAASRARGERSLVRAGRSPWHPGRSLNPAERSSRSRFRWQ